MNTKVILDYKGLFIYIDCGYPRSYHDVNILGHFNIYQEWQQYFIHDDEYFEFLLGDPRYMGKKMFIMQRIGRREITPNANMDVMHAYNNMHVSYRL
jgi:hypothetical protein